MKIKDYFKLIQGHQITDEELYLAEGDIPVLTGQNEVKGYWGNAIVSDDQLPVITYPTKGNHGDVYIQYSVFDANNTAVLIPKDEFKGCVNLEWLSFQLSHVFLNIQTSKEGVSYLNKSLVEEVELDLPELSIQAEQLDYHNKLIKLKRILEERLQAIDSLLSKNIL